MTRPARFGYDPNFYPFAFTRDDVASGIVIDIVSAALEPMRTGSNSWPGRSFKSVWGTVTPILAVLNPSLCRMK